MAKGDAFRNAIIHKCECGHSGMVHIGYICCGIINGQQCKCTRYKEQTSKAAQNANT